MRPDALWMVPQRPAALSDSLTVPGTVHQFLGAQRGCWCTCSTTVP